MLIRAIRGDYKPATVTVKVPILTPTVLQWTGASPWMDLVQRALTWEAREPDLYVNVFFGFPFADVPDVGMTIQAMSNGKPELARKVADDMATWAWRRREALLEHGRGPSDSRGREAGQGSDRARARRRSCWPTTATARARRPGFCSR